MVNILMLEPKSPGKHIYSRFKLPRLGLPILGTLAKRRGHSVRVLFEEEEKINPGLIAESDLLCLSSITATIPRSYEFASMARKAGVKVLIGGSHVTYRPEEALDHTDWVLRGESEKSFPLFLEMFEGRVGPEEVPGLSYRIKDEIIHNPLDARVVSMDEVPIVDFSLLSGRSGKRFCRGIIPVQTSRGCPHHCKFCSVTPMFGRRMRYTSPERVGDQLERHRGKGDMVFFYDDNFCASPKKTKELLDHLLTRNVFLPPWICQVSVRASRDEELLALMRRSGCHTVFVGFESIQPEALELYRKRQSVDDIRQSIRRFHKHGIRIHGMFMAGSDAEDVDTIRATARFAIQEDIESIQFLLLTPFPGTDLFDEFEEQGRLITRDWTLYDTHHTVFNPAKMSSYTLMNESFAAMAKFNTVPRAIGQFLQGRWHRGSVSLYAHLQVKRWLRENRKLLRAAKRQAASPSAPGVAPAGS